MPLSCETIGRINEVFQTAQDEGRHVLYEHEIYRILDHVGIETPGFQFVSSPAHVDEKVLNRFANHLVLKIVSPDISHKNKIGGVRPVRSKDPLFIEFVLNKMRADVLSHFPHDQPPGISGFLLVEYVPHTRALGYEVLLGIREDPAFGPVCTLSKGGDDAEFFAKHYDPANLFLPPLNIQEASKICRSLNIRHKFEEIGHSEYLDLFARAASRLSCLAFCYSFVSGDNPGFIIKTLDINPLVITRDGRFVAIDGYACFEPCHRAVAVSRDYPDLEGFFNPNGIAVIGVSANMEKSSPGRNIALQLHDNGREDLYLINPKGGAIRFDDKEYPLFTSLADLPAPVDLVVYAAPARSVTEFFRKLPVNRPKAVILISGIPSKLPYSEYVKELDALDLDGVRVIGPNCMGVYYGSGDTSRELNTLFIEEERLSMTSRPESNTALLTQSGAFAVTAIDRFQNAGLLKAVVSFGNKYDVKIVDLMACFANNPEIDVIALYIEGLDTGEGWQFFQLAQTIGKPVIVYKAGKTDAGAKAAASHTASISGSYDVFRAACMQSGVILAENLDDHCNYVKAFSLLSGKKPAGRRVAGIVNAGFESAVGADELIHLTQADLSPDTKQRLDALDRFGLIDTSSSLLDLTPMADDSMYADFVAAVLDDDGVDCVFVSVVPHTNTLKTLPGSCNDPDALAQRLAGLNRRTRKPLVVSVNAGQYYQDFVSLLEMNGLPVYPNIRSAVKSLDCFVTHAL